MEAFNKISTSRNRTDDKSVLINDIYFNKSRIFTKKNVEEIVEFVKKECPEVMGGNTFYVNSFPHLFGGSNTNSKKFMFVLSCLRDREGEPLFNLGYESGLRCISIVNSLVIETGDDKKVDIVIDSDDKKDDNLDDKKDDNPDDKKDDNLDDKKDDNPDDNPDDKKDDNPDDNPDDKKDDNPDDNPDDKKGVVLMDTIADKFTLKELRKICKTIDGVKNKDVKRLNEKPLVAMIIKNKTKEEIQKMLGL